MKLRQAVLVLVVGSGVLGGVAPGGPAQAAEAVTVIELAGRAGDISLGELSLIAAKHLGRDIGAADRAVVVTDLGGTPLPAAWLRRLFAGGDVGAVKLLATVEKPAPGTTVAELAKPTGTAATVAARFAGGGFAQTHTHCTALGCVDRIVVTG